MAESWGRAVRIFAGRARPPAARLRARSARAPALERCERLARGRRDRHLALPPRSLGRSRSVGLGDDVGPRAGAREARALAPTRRSRGAGRVRHALRDARHVHPRVRAEGVRGRRGVRGGRAQARRDQAPALHGADVRLPRLEHARGRLPTRATRGRASGWRGWPRVSTSSCARRRWSGASWTGSRAAISRPTRPSPRSKLRVRSGCCSRTARRSSASTTASSRRTTGSSWTSSSRFGAPTIVPLLTRFRAEVPVTLIAGGGWTASPPGWGVALG